jgi:ribosomal protein S18 acetylase RimI-like enzyme
MFYTIIYKNLSQNQKLNILNFVKENFQHIEYNNFGMEKETIIIVNYEEDKIIGCVCLLNNRCLKEILTNAHANLINYNFDYNNGLFMYNLCVSINHRNKKIANKMIDIALELCKKIGIDYIHCHAENEISRNLFLNKCFMEDKTINIKENNFYLMSKFI